ncbi:MAG: D-alanyl-D-alanine carboxypeptidase family protein [Halocynthiibacter sp.]
MRYVLVIIAFFMQFGLSHAQEFTTNARAAYVYDLTTDTVLLEKNANQALPPASMSKLMTVYMTFEALRDGRLSLNERLPVSQHAMNYGGSTMFLTTRDRVSVLDLLKGVIILSGNDACAVLAEALSTNGTEEHFATMMTERARALGMENSTFGNSNGWPHPKQRMSMRDLGILAARLLSDFPEHYYLFAEREFLFDGRAPDNKNNRNPLLKLGIGADGFKTGHTQEAGYGLVGSAQKGDRRVIAVITGLESERERATEAERIMTWAFRQFTLQTQAKKNQPIADLPVYRGQQSSVKAVLSEDIVTLKSVTGTDETITEIIYNTPLIAPINAGDEIGTLTVKNGTLLATRHKLIAGEDVAKGGFLNRIGTAFRTVNANIMGLFGAADAQ